MAVDLKATLEAARGHLRDGAIQAADDLITTTLIDYAVEQAAAGNAPEATARTANMILVDFANLVASKFGNPPELLALIHEFEALA